MADIPQVCASEVPEGATILDVREPNEHEAGHAPGVVSIPMGQVRERLADVPQATPLYVMCRSGGRSQAVAEFLASQGRDVANVAGGHLKWKDSGRTLISETGDTPDVVTPTTPPPAEV